VDQRLEDLIGLPGVNRRAFLASLGLVGLAPSSARAQPARRPGKARVAVLGPTPSAESLSKAFKQGLGDLGFVDGQNTAVEFRDGDGRPERLPEIAAELVRSGPDVLFARGGGALSALQRATRTIPIVAVDLESDPVARGFVRNLAQPGGNITGVFLDLPQVSGKQLQILKEVLPATSRVAVLGDPVFNGPQFQATDAAARSLSIQPQRLDVRVSQDLEGAMDAASRAQAHAVLLLSSPLVFFHRAEIGALALKRRLPAVSMFMEFAEAGGLMAYGPSLRESFRRAGGFVGRILQGAKPADMPVERPATFELVVNQKTARALGLTVPASVMSRADRVVE
jgi:ABC-type uncharacterized transport system substrate-binding protein